MMQDHPDRIRTGYAGDGDNPVTIKNKTAGSQDFPMTLTYDSSKLS